MRKAIRVLTLFSIFIFLAVAGLANELLFYKEMQAPKNMENEVGVATFDSQMYLNTDNSLTNIRIYDPNKKEFPYVVRKLRGSDQRVQEHPVKMKILSLEELSDNRLSIVVEMDYEDENQAEAMIPSDLTIKTSNSNFEKTVCVFGSDDNNQWNLLCADQPIFDYSRFIDLRNTSVSFEKKPYKYYKVVIDNVAQVLISSFSQIFTKYAKGKVQEEYASVMRYQGVLHINKLEFISREENQVYGEKKMIPYSLEIAEVKINKKDKTSDIYLNSQREPLSRMLFSIENKNFKRKILVQANNALDSEPHWISLGSVELYNISAGDFHKESLTIDLASKENRYKQYRVRIFNYDNLPIELSSVRGEGPVYELAFFHNNEKKLKVYYGGQAVKAPHYDVASVLAEIPLVSGVHWELGQEQVNENADQKQKPLINPKNMLIIALTMMVIVLLCLITFSVKKVDEITK